MNSRWRGGLGGRIVDGRVEHVGVEIDTVGPDQGARLRVYRDPGEVVGILQRLEYPTSTNNPG